MNKKYRAQDIDSLTDIEIQKLFDNKVVSIQKEGKDMCFGTVVNFFNCANNDNSQRKICGLILNNVEISFVDDLEFIIRDEKWYNF